MKCLKTNVIGKYCRRFEDVVICFFPQDGVVVLFFSFAVSEEWGFFTVWCAVLCWP